jgi:hydrogenase expression/formation protein HypC
MCLAIPGKIEKINAFLDDIFRQGTVAFGEVRKEINLSMVPKAQVGDYVLVHVGVAISIVDEDEAKKTFDLLQKLGEIGELEAG